MVGKPGRPGEPNQSVPEDAGSGETRELIVGDTGNAKRRGNSKLSQPAPPKDVRIEATRRSIAGKAGDEDEGQPEDSSKAEPQEWGTGATQDSKTGDAEASEIRGNLKIDSRHSQSTEQRGNPKTGDRQRQRRRGTGKPGSANQAEQDDAGAGATLNLHREADGSMHDPTSCKFTIRGRQRLQGLWRFRLLEREAGHRKLTERSFPMPCGVARRTSLQRGDAEIRLFYPTALRAGPNTLRIAWRYAKPCSLSGSR
jgi:hypothetical protein